MVYSEMSGNVMETRHYTQNRPLLITDINRPLIEKRHFSLSKFSQFIIFIRNVIVPKV